MEFNKKKAACYYVLLHQKTNIAGILGFQLSYFYKEIRGFWDHLHRKTKNVHYSTKDSGFLILAKAFYGMLFDEDCRRKFL